MSTRVLVAYATRYGSTQEVDEVIAQTLNRSGLPADVMPARQVRTLAGYGPIVLGAALYMHLWHKDAIRVLSRVRAALSERPVAVFALGPVHDPHDEHEWQESLDQLDAELARLPWLTPVAVALFGGKFDPQTLSFPWRQLASSEPATDIRDWEAIRDWAANLYPMFTGLELPGHPA